MAGLPPTIADASVTLSFGAAGVYYGYCTITDVQFEFPDRSSFTTLTNSIVGQEITYAAQEVQEQLALVYQMPYAGTDGGILLRLRDLNAKLATANLIARYFQGSEPNLSPAGDARRQWAEMVLKDILDGVIQWSGQFGDALAQSEKVLYPLSAGATVMPSPDSVDPFAATPVFTMGRTHYRRGGIL